MLCYVYVIFLSFFFFKQKTAYEMRISDWSSDVCSSDLTTGLDPEAEGGVEGDLAAICNDLGEYDAAFAHFVKQNAASAKSALRKRADKQIGRASCRERVCQYV